MTGFKLLLLAGDGVGPEIMSEVVRVIEWFNANTELDFSCEHGLVGGAAYDDCAKPLPQSTLSLAKDADAVLLGAVGGAKWSDVGYDLRPEAALLMLREQLGVFANLRPAICYPALTNVSSLKPDLVSGLDMLIVRELTGGVYFGRPQEIVRLEDGRKRAIDSQIYHCDEIYRIAKTAFDLARTRKKLVHSVEKSNVMKTGQLWREVVTKMHQESYGDIKLEHVLADNCAMQLVRCPKQFDVIVTDNLFGDVLSDVAAMLTGSLGMLPSASLSGLGDHKPRCNAIYEPVHGSAPDIAGKNIVNPIAMIASFAMALRYSFNFNKEADLLEKAISAVLAQGFRTADICREETGQMVGTDTMGAQIVKALSDQADLAAS